MKLSRIRLINFATMILLLGVSPAIAQDHQHAQGEADDTPMTFPAELLERPVTIRTGTGAQTIVDPVTTTSKEAQAFYSQGVAYLHGYVWCDAMITGAVAHSCRHGPPPHHIKVCITRIDNKDVWRELERAAPPRAGDEPGARSRRKPRRRKRACRRRAHVPRTKTLPLVPVLGSSLRLARAQAPAGTQGQELDARFRGHERRVSS